jgi:hypothetical protein
VGTRNVPVKRVPNLAPTVIRSTVEATAVQLRVLAEETRELIIDRLMATPIQRPGVRVVQRPVRLRQGVGPTADRRPFDFDRLRNWYARKKRRLGLDGHFLIASRDYIEGIEVFKGKQQSGVYYMVRPAQRFHVPSEVSSTSNIMLSLLARVLEFGSAKHRVPARPHWRPVLRAVIARVRFARRDIRAAGLRQFIQRLR